MLKRAAVVFLICAGMATWVGCVTTSSRYLYASLPQSDQIVAYREDPNSGILTVLASSPVAAGPGVQSIAIHPSGKFLYAANSGENDVSLFTIASNGTITEVTPRAQVGTAPKLLVIDSAGQFLYVGDSGSTDIYAFSIDATTGALAQVGSSFQIGVSPLNMKLSPSGNFLYVTAASQLAGQPGYIEVFSVASGALTFVPPAVQPGSSPYGLAIDPSGAHLYTANFGDNTISEFTINSDGTLTELSGSPMGESYTGPVSLFIDNSGKYLYVANQQSSGNIAGYQIGSDGGLTLLTTSTNSIFPTASEPNVIAGDPGGKFLFVGNQSSSSSGIQSFSLNTGTGNLTSVATYSPGGTPTSIAVSP